MLGAIVLCCVPVCANAADIYGNEGNIFGDEVPYVAQSTWAGFYAGGHIGATFDDTFARGGAETELDNGLNLGVHVGYNWASQSFLVYGVEADLGIVDDEFQGDGVTDYAATLRGRIGYDNGSSLIYATGGLAWVGYDPEFADDNQFDDKAIGYVLGLGWDHKLTSNMGVGLEGLYFNVNANEDIFGGDLNQQVWIIRARASYYLNSGYEDPLK